MKTTPTTEDRVWTVLAHLSALSLGMGIVVPVIGWSDQRRKSNYASFQCLQALGYQSLGFTVWALLLLLVTVIGILILLLTSEEGGMSLNGLLSAGAVVFLLLILGLFSLYLVLPMIAAVACALGKDFRYPILGNQLAQYLEYETGSDSDGQEWLQEIHEFRWVAAMGHFSILILLWGMLAPLTAWMVQGRRSPFLRFQSVQALAYQAMTTVILLIGGIFYILGFAFLFTVMSQGGTDVIIAMGIPVLIVFGGSVTCSFVLLLLVPLLHILGQWAGYRVLKGDDFRYPLLGRLVDRWIPRDVVEENSP